MLKLGHFAANRWTPGGADSASIAELFVGGEGQGAESVLATLLHVAAHGVADIRQVQDTSRQGRYHNARYKALAEEVSRPQKRVRREPSRVQIQEAVLTGEMIL